MVGQAHTVHVQVSLKSLCRVMPAHRRPRRSTPRGSPKPSRSVRTSHQPGRTSTPTPTTSLPSPTSAPLAASPSVSDLLSQSRLTSEEWYRSSRTTKAYAGYVKSGKAFLESWTDEATLAGEIQHTASGDPEEGPTFAGAFDDIGPRTPIALRLLTAYKCDHQGKGFSTAEGIRSAFKSYFERYVGSHPLVFFTSWPFCLLDDS